MEENYVDKSKVYLQEIPKKQAKNIIIEKHYTHKASSCRYALGIFYKEDSPHPFFENESKEKLIGCMTLGFPVGRRVLGSIFSEDIGLETTNLLELTRLYIDDGYGKNIESLVLGGMFAWLKRNAPNIKVLISYADPEQNHSGKIYQATNWLYQGCGEIQMAPTFSLRLTEDGEWIHSRTVYSLYGSAAPKNLIKKIGKTFWLKKEAEKHRYLYFIGNKKENRLYKSTLKHKLYPYPADTINTAEIQKVEVEEVREVDKFI